MDLPLRSLRGGAGARGAARAPVAIDSRSTADSFALCIQYAICSKVCSAQCSCKLM